MAEPKLTQYDIQRQIDFAIGNKYGRLTIIGKPFHFKNNITKIKVEFKIF